MSLGVYIDINCSSLTESKTEITIEVRRKVGSFNQSHEVTLANTHIVKITDLIAESVGTDEQERIQKAEMIVAAQPEHLNISLLRILMLTSLSSRAQP